MTRRVVDALLLFSSIIEQKYIFCESPGSKAARPDHQPQSHWSQH